MRKKKELQSFLEISFKSSLKEVNSYYSKYNNISAILDENPVILDLVHKDFEMLSSDKEKKKEDKGRSGDFTSENLFRACIIHDIEQTSFRETIVRIAASPFLNQFLRLGTRDPMDHTFLSRALKCIKPKTWKAINEVLGNYAVEQEIIDTSKIRTDTTLVETNIHYPTDASLLWDTWKVCTRLLREGNRFEEIKGNYRFHDRKVKKLYIAIVRLSGNKKRERKQKKRTMKKDFRELIGHVQRVVGIAESFCEAALRYKDLAAGTVASKLESFLPQMKQVIDQSIRSSIEGEKVPGPERVFSIFEPHTELIKRGKRKSPVEFGHMIMIAETADTFITDYEVMEKRVHDSCMTDEIVERHKKLFGGYPEVLAGDTGFCSNAEVMKALREKIDVVAIPGKVADRKDGKLSSWYKFRAGVEGTISVLKRVFKLLRCLNRGFKSFASHIGHGIFCHNLVLLGRLNE